MNRCYVGEYTSISPRGTGGAENFLRRLCEGRRKDDKYLLFSSNHKVYLENSDSTCNYEFSAGVINLAKFLMEHKKEFAFCPVGVPMVYRVIINFLSILRIIKVERILFNYPEFILKRTLYFSEALLFSDKIFFLSDRQNDFIERLSFLNVNSIECEKLHPIVPSHFHSKKKAGLRGNGDKCVISFVGRFDRDKGIEETLSIMRVLRRRDDVELNVYYLEGRNKEYVKETIEEYYASGIEFVLVDKMQSESLYHNELIAAEILKKSDIFLQPYRKLCSAIEAPLLLYEASAAGCYIMTTSLSGIIEHLSGDYWINKNGIENFVEEAIDEIERYINRNKRK